MKLPVLLIAAITLSDVTEESGITFRHVTGADGKKYMIETMGAGAAFFDYDGDGDSDLLFINGGDPTGRGAGSTSAATLYRNDGRGRFTETTAVSGLVHIGYGMGVTAGDYDNDGDVDLYLTHYGPNVLFRNNGDGTFTDVTKTAGVGDAHWGASATWTDLDNDGFIDLYVTNYVNWTLSNNPNCSQLIDGEMTLAYCLPEAFSGVPDTLYRNRGDSTFEAVGESAGIALPSGKGLGVVSLDYDHDGLTDLYVANDTVPNFLFHNKGGFRFEEVGLLAGVAYDADGHALAGMGIGRADYDRDGDIDLFVTNFQGESNTLYRNDANGFFTDVTIHAGLARPSLDRLGFGTLFVDLDNDGYDDLFVANGHIEDADTLHSGPYEQPNQVFRNEGGGRFSVLELAEKQVSRGLAVADIDDDFDLDLAVSNSGGPAQLLRNDTDLLGAVRLRLIGRASNRDGLGAAVRVASRRFEVVAATSYMSQSENVIHIGVGAEETIDSISVRWPSGVEETRGPFRAGERVLWVEGATPD